MLETEREKAMLEQFHPYFREIGMARALIGRAEQICESFAPLFAGPIERLFVTDHKDENGRQVFDSIWLFSGAMTSECRKFVTDDSMDFVSTARTLKWMQLKRVDYEIWDSPRPESRLTLEASFVDSQSMFTLDATGQNCKYLFNLSKTDFLRYLR